MDNAVDTGCFDGTDRAEPRVTRPMLLPSIQLHERNQYSVSPLTSSSSDKYEDEIDWRTPSAARRTDTDMYSSGRYGGEINTSSDIDDDMDFYEADSSQPAFTADAVRSFDAPSSHLSCRSLADCR